MKKQILIPLGLIFLGGLCYLYLNKQTHQTKSDFLTLSWYDLRKDQLQSISTSIYTKNQTNTYHITKNKGTWELTEPINIAISQEKALLLVNSFLTMLPQKQITNATAQDFSSYGLDNPNYKISGVYNNQPKGIIIGQKTSIDDFYYISELNDSNTIYLIESSKIEPFLQGASALINNKFMQKSSEQVIAIDFKNIDDQSMTFTNIDYFWTQLTPVKEKNVDWEVRKVLLIIKDLTFYPQSIDFDISPQKLVDFGIDMMTSPYLKLTFNDSTTASLYLGKKYEDNLYPIYMPQTKMVAFANEDILLDIFNTKETDFLNINKK